MEDKWKKHWKEGGISKLQSMLREGMVRENEEWDLDERD